MKRSEMVEKIAEDLLELCGGDKAEQEEVRESTKMTRLKFAHYSLKSAEKYGMLPPEYFYKDDFAGDGMEFETLINEWESENFCAGCRNCCQSCGDDNETK